MNHHPDSRVTAPEAALLIGAAVAISSGLIVWIGAALSAALSGERLTGGLSDGVRAAFRLPEHWREPGQRGPLRPTVRSCRDPCSTGSAPSSCWSARCSQCGRQRGCGG